jgi:hypothetical protein
MMLISPMDALSFSLCFDTTSLAHCDAVWGERHPPHLHELIHDVQLLNRDWDCAGSTEWEAYRLQDQWLQEQGVILPFDWPAIRRLSECPPDVP